MGAVHVAPLTRSDSMETTPHDAPHEALAAYRQAREEMIRLFRQGGGKWRGMPGLLDRLSQARARLAPTPGAAAPALPRPRTA